MQQGSLRLVVRPPPKEAESSSHRAEVERPFHPASRCKMVAGGSDATKESEACGSGPPIKQRVCPVERELRHLFSAPLGTKWQPAALMLQRSLGLVVRGPPPNKQRVHPAER
ncbi:hypothetical protein NDU88_000983 [Pleurodeles waltl]|uniref:Uncharacterized protein n=1 Tax=Pleurodeles waltl TaxID=8319 RepID=A0AAV7TH24_PLEWA|nr:hypothetical protein NDU88_000983 [Pleurodeles waltl]